MNAEAVQSLGRITTRLRVESLGLQAAWTSAIRKNRELRSQTRSLVSQTHDLTRVYVQDSLRRAIRRKLVGGRLPFDRAASVAGAPGTGGICDACDRPLLPAHLTMAVPSGEGRPVQLHADCFMLWDVERRMTSAACSAAATDKRPAPTLGQSSFLRRLVSMSPQPE
jgi:hypothetical protein